MIAAAGWHRLRLDGPTPLDVGAYPNLRLASLTLARVSTCGWRRIRRP